MAWLFVTVITALIAPGTFSLLLFINVETPFLFI